MNGCLNSGVDKFAINLCSIRKIYGGAIRKPIFLLRCGFKVPFHLLRLTVFMRRIGFARYRV